MKTLLSILFCSITLALFGQSIERQVISSSGNYTESGGLSLSSTVGETAIATGKSTDIILTQGFQQPDESDAEETNVGIEKVIDKMKISAFPNPTSDKVILEINANQETELRIELLDLNGKRLNNNAVEQVSVFGKTVHEIDMQKYSTGHYLIRLSDESGKYSESIKIQKVAH